MEYANAELEQQYVNDCRKMLEIAVRLSYNIASSTLPNLYKNEIQGPPSFDEVAGALFKAQFFKGWSSYLQKYNNLKEGQFMTDAFRFTKKLTDEITKDRVVTEMKVITELMKQNNFKLYKIKLKLKDTGYSDATLIFETEEEGKKIYLEVQINSEAGLKAKKEEDSENSNRKDIASHLLELNSSLKERYNLKELRETINAWLLQKIDVNKDRKPSMTKLGRELKIFEEKLEEKDIPNLWALISYKDSFLRSRLIFELARPILYSKESAIDIAKLFVATDPENYKDIGISY